MSEQSLPGAGVYERCHGMNEKLKMKNMNYNLRLQARQKSMLKYTR